MTERAPRRIEQSWLFFWFLFVVATLGVRTGNAKEPEVFPYTSAEISAYCGYLKERSGLDKGARADASLRDCLRQQQALLTDQRTACIRNSSSANPSDRNQSVESCVRRGTKFEESMQDRKDFDAFQNLISLEDFAKLGQRLMSSGDRLGLMPEVRFRMNALCASQAPVDSKIDWHRLLDSVGNLKTGGACDQLAEKAQERLAKFESQELEERNIAYAKLLKTLEAETLQPSDVEAYASQHSLRPNYEELYSLIVARVANARNPQWAEIWFKAIGSYFHGALRTHFHHQLEREVEKGNFIAAKKIRFVLLDAKVSINPAISESYKSLALKSGQFDDVREYAEAGELTAVKAAFSRANTSKEKQLAELYLVKIVADKLLNVSTEIRSNSGATVEGSKGGLLSALFGAKIMSDARADIHFTVTRDDDIVRITQPYTTEIEFRLAVIGTRRWEKKCGLLWLDTCRGEDKNFSQDYKTLGRIVMGAGNVGKVQGVASVDWKPVWAGTGIHGGYLMGGSQAFEAHSVRVDVASVKILGIAE